MSSFIIQSHSNSVHPLCLDGQLKSRQVQFWAEYKMELCIKCNFGVDKRVIEEIGQMLLAPSSSPHLVDAADTSRSYHRFASP